MVVTRSQSKIIKTSPASSIKNVRRSSRKIEKNQNNNNNNDVKKDDNLILSEYTDWLMSVEDASARSDLFQTILWNFVNNGSNKDLTLEEKIKNFYNMYKVINFYMCVFKNEFSDKGVKSQLSKSRFKLGREMFNKAHQLRIQIIENEYIETKQGIDLNTQLSEYIHTWMVNEYIWFPVKWRKTENILLQ